MGRGRRGEVVSDRPVTAGLRVDSRNEGHVTLSVFVGRNEGARGHSGRITLRADEWREFGHVDADGKLIVAFDLAYATAVEVDR